MSCARTEGKDTESSLHILNADALFGQWDDNVGLFLLYLIPAKVSRVISAISQRMLTVLSRNQRGMTRSSVRPIMMGLDSLEFPTAT